MSSANGSRTRVFALRGRRPRPLDDSAVQILNSQLLIVDDVGIQNLEFNILKLLPGKGSNLDFPDPESGVLPITPPGNACFRRLYKFVQLLCKT